MSRPAVVLFDLGGVLVDVGGVDAMQPLAGIVDEAELWDRWLSCRWVRSFERGGCSAEAFAVGVMADWALAVSPEEFLSSFRSWVGAPLAGADGLVADVAGVVPVGCLSNTDPEHWSAAERCDDSQMNVDAAGATGFTACRARGVAEARAALEDAGVLTVR